MARKGNTEALERYWRNRILNEGGGHEARESSAPLFNPSESLGGEVVGSALGGEVVGSALGVGLAVVVFWGLCTVLAATRSRPDPRRDDSLLRYNWRTSPGSDWGS